MTLNLDPLIRTLDRHVPAIAPAAQLCVRLRGRRALSLARGTLDRQTATRPVTPHTRFDLASVTKLFVVTAFMRLVDAGRVTLDQSVATVLPAFSGNRPIAPYEDPLNPGAFVEVIPTPGNAPGTVDAAAVTFRHLLTHTAGLPAWRPLFRQADAAAARRMALTTFFSAPPDTHIVYSDIGLILLGMAVEALHGAPLDVAVRTLVLEPLGLTQTAYRAAALVDDGACAPTEFCAWRGRRIVGAVHDENAFRLGGVAGHAGLFSTAEDVARFGQLFLDGGAPLLQAATVAAMTRPHAEEGAVRRGLGFALWSPDPEAGSHPFSPRTFGHTGFTGTSLWIDPERELVVALLTNEVYHGRTARRLATLRLDIHRTLIAAIDAHIVDAQTVDAQTVDAQTDAHTRVAGESVSLPPQDATTQKREHSSMAHDTRLTEARNPASADIDLVSTLDLVRIINTEDAKVAFAVATEAPRIAAAIDGIVARMRQGGRLIYAGAGTSGRLGVLDASECPPTYSAPPGLVVGLIAGGAHALTNSIEGAEDRPEDGAYDVASMNVSEIDTLVGIAASGGTPYTLGAMEEAKRRGALVISLTCNAGSPMAASADIAIEVLVGPEVVTGSTRMKAGTAQKMVLNMLSTGAMIGLGKTFGNLMVDVQPSNTKLRARARRIVAEAAGLTLPAAAALLDEADGEVKTAILMALLDLPAQAARERLTEAGGVIRRAVASAAGADATHDDPRTKGADA